MHHRGSPGLAGEVLAGLPGGGHTVVQADLADAEAVRRMVDQAHADLGGLDVVVNNAGIYVPHPITDVSYQQWQDAWQETLAVNLAGAANVTWCAVQYMKETGGRIINVTSRGAYRGEPRHPAYGASKAGLNSFGQSMARALAPLGIAVATVAPGYVETDMTVDELNSPAGRRSGGRARSGGWRRRRKSPPPWSTWPPPRPSGPAGPSSTSTEPRTCASCIDVPPVAGAALLGLDHVHAPPPPRPACAPPTASPNADPGTVPPGPAEGRVLAHHGQVPGELRPAWYHRPR